MLTRNLLTLGMMTALLPAAASRVGTGSPTPPTGEEARVAEAYGRLPLSFERNQGQAAAGVEYLSRGRGYSLFLTSSEAVLSLRGSAPRTPAVVRVKLVGARPDPEVSGSGELPGKSHYFVGNDPRRWRTDVPHFARVRYERVYPGVDLVYHGDQGRLEYDFVVSPGSDPRPIRLRVEGAQDVRLDDSGNLVLQTSAGPLVHQAPLVYQDVDGERRPVEGAYALRDGGEVGFDIGEYDASEPLVIDPVVQLLEYSTYLGGNGRDSARDVAVDGSGFAYVTGLTDSTDFPTKDPIQPDGAIRDVFVTKLSPSGSSLVYSAYLGGNDDDIGYGIAIDGSGGVWVAGQTYSTDFPTAAAYQPAPGNPGGSDAFVARLSASGSSLVYSTYLGGSANDGALAVALDATASAYVSGWTNSTDFPTVNPYQGNQGSTDAFVAKLSPSGTSAVYSTYLGGGDYETGAAIAVDASGSAYVTGTTWSTDFPTSAPYQADQAGWDAFVTKLSPSGSSLVYSTYLGGGSTDEGFDIALDALGCAYVTGSTESTDFPTVNPYQTDQVWLDVFATKLSPEGTSLVYSTYVGGSASDIAYGIAVDAAGSAYLAGYTYSADFPTRNAFEADQPGLDAFVTKLSPSGSDLGWSTYLGGGGDDLAHRIAVDGAGSAYVAGDTESTDFPTLGAYQSDQPDTDAFVAKLSSSTPQSFHTLTPCRVIDTRNAAAALGGPALACSSTPLPRTFPLAGACGIPSTARAISYNVTVTQATAPGHLRLFPAASVWPLASSINYSAGKTRGNNGIVLLGTGHLAVSCHQSSGTAHAIVDVNGYFDETPES